MKVAVDAIAAAGLKELPGITGSADEAAELFAKGELKPNFEAKCDHNGEHHHEYSLRTSQTLAGDNYPLQHKLFRSD